MPWINHLPPVCWSTFGILVWNDSGYVNLTQWWYFFIIFEYILHISTPHIMIFCFPLPYFPLSQQVLYFLLSTLVLTLYIDVVLSLSIGSPNLTYENLGALTSNGKDHRYIMLSHVFTHCGQGMPYGDIDLGQVNIGSGNGLLPDGAKPLPEPVSSHGISLWRQQSVTNEICFFKNDIQISQGPMS